MMKCQDVVLNTRGEPISGASVTVLTYPGGATATIYSDNGVTPATNPLTTNSSGRFTFYAADGHYSLSISGTGIIATTITDILLEDPADVTAGVFSTVSATGAISSTSATGGIGYAIGAGGTVVQATNKSTGVTLSKVTGEITMNGAALAADTTVSFTLTNTAIAAGDHVIVQHVSAGTQAAYNCTALAAAGSATINVHNLTPGALSEAIVLKFTVIKAVTS